MPTTQLYSSMIKIAGLAGKLDLALDLQVALLLSVRMQSQSQLRASSGEVYCLHADTFVAVAG